MKRPIRQRLVAAAAAALALLWLPAAQAADTLLLNGELLTMDAAKPRAQALAVRGNRIVAVGSNAAIRKLRTAHTRVIDLGGKTVVPGLIDAHIHAIRGGQGFTFESYWYEQTTLPGALDQLAQEAAKRGPGRWVAVMGAWHPAQFAEQRAPTPQDLSTALPHNPAYVQYLYDYAVVNTKAIDVLGLDTGAALPPGITVERDAQGRATGKLLGGIGPFSALFARISARPEAENRASLQAFFSELNRLGVTGVVDPAAGDHAIYSPLFTLWRDKALTVRVAYRASALAPGNETAWFKTSLAYLPPLFGDDMLRFLGVGEVLAFGMNDGVRMSAGFNPPQAARDELAQAALFAAERRYPLEIHAYTEDGAKAILDVLEKVAQTRPFKDLRWALTHINTGSEQTFERMRKLGLAYTVQMGPYFEAPAIQEAHGAEAAQASPPTRLALRKGLMVAGGTDSTRVGVINVWRAIEYHVTGRAVGGAVQRRADHLLTREEALRLYTANAAWLTFSEPHRGSLTEGKLADFAVLDAPFLTVAPDDIHKIRSVLTFVDGKPVHVAPHHGAALPPRTDARVLKAVGQMHDHGDDAEGAAPRH